MRPAFPFPGQRRWTDIVLTLLQDVSSFYSATTRLISLNPELYYSAPLSLNPPPVSLFESNDHAIHGKNLLRAVKTSDIASLENLLFPLAPFAIPEAVLADPSVAHELGDTASTVLPSRQGVVGIVNFVDEDGLSPLHHAVRLQPSPDLRVIELLFAAGADFNLACISRSTPLHHLACFGGSDHETTRRNFSIRQQRELAHSAKVVDHERQRTMTGGASSSSKDIITKAGRMVPSPGQNLTPASEATSDIRGLPEVKIDDKEVFKLADSETEIRLKDAVALLLRLGASPDIADCSGALPLHFAAEVRPLPCSRACSIRRLT